MKGYNWFAMDKYEDIFGEKDKSVLQCAFGVFYETMGLVHCFGTLLFIHIQYTAL